MKDIEGITVKVTYRVGIGGLQVPEIVFEQLTEIEKTGCEVDDLTTEYQEAAEWLRDNIREGDSYDLEYEVEELS